MFSADEEDVKPVRASTQTALTICHSPCAWNTCQNICLILTWLVLALFAPPPFGKQAITTRRAARS